ncbi:MAG: flagellar basal body L-ring protein FlgH [Planctomycetota bacterium]|jgi:flagellar basal body L-ring protein FlgH
MFRTASFYIAICLITMFLFGADVSADIIAKSDETQETLQPFRDPEEVPVEIKEGEIIHVRILESATGSAQGDESTDRRTRTEIALNEWVKIAHGKLESSAPGQPGIDIDARHRTDATGDTSRGNELRAQIAATVVQVYPKSNTVLIEARKAVTINREKSVIVLTGRIAVRDILRDEKNRYKIDSDYVADADVRYEGEGGGPVTSTQRRGLLSKIMDWLWPF